MKALHLSFLAASAIALALTARAPQARAQLTVGDDYSTGALSDTSYASLLRRVDALEASLYVPADGSGGGWQEVDVIGKPTVKLSGRIHADYWPMPDSSPLANFLETADPAVGPRDFIGFRRMRFGVDGDINETMLYKIEMDFAEPSGLAFKDVYLGWREMPVLRTVLLGQQKRPYGLAHMNSSRYTVFMERPFVIEGFNQDTRRLGVCSYGVSENERWNWRYGGFVMDDLSKVGGQYADNYQAEVAGRLANTIWYDETSGGRGYAHWAISATAAFPGNGPDARFLTRPEARTSGKWFDTGQIAGGDSYQLLGTEGVLNVGALSVVGEYQTVRMQRRAGASDLEFHGGYIFVAYFLTGEHTPWSRDRGTLGRTRPFENFFVVRRCEGGCARGWGAWQIAARYSHGDFSDDNVFGGVGESFTFGLNWWWNPNARMQFNYLYGQITDRVAPAGVGPQGWYNIFGTRFTVDF